MAIVLEGNLHDHFFGSATATVFSQAERRHAREKNRTKLGETEEEIKKNERG